MKKTIIFTVLVLLSILSISAQSYSNSELFNKFQRKELSYNDFEKKL